MTPSTITATAPGLRSPGDKAPDSGLPWFAGIEQRAGFVAFVQTLNGQLILCLLAILATLPYFGSWPAVLAVCAAMAAAARVESRDLILVTATWSTAFLTLWLDDNETIDSIGLILHQQGLAHLSPSSLATAFLLLLAVAAAMASRWVPRHPQSVLARRPLLTLLTLEALLCGLASLEFTQGLARGMLWAAILMLTPYLWFLPYAIADQRSRTPASLPMQLAVLRPFWSPGHLPFGKGAAFLRKHLAPNPHELAITQIKGIKLLLWANILFAIKTGLSWLFGEHMGVPTVAQALDALLANQPYPLLLGWAAVILSTAKFSLQIAIWAHLFVGVARLAGYRLPRGSWRPLESRTLMEYFNRFHYYFKELLVDLFFIPTFFKMFRKHPRLRMFFATFMAAGVGNAIWHFVRDIDQLALHGPAAALESFASYAFYCLILATGVGLSQVRANLGIRPSPTLAGRIYSFFFVWSFVVCLHVFSDGSRNHTLGERLTFLASLFGVS